MRTYSSRAAVAASILALALAGCGSSSKKTTSSTATSTPASTSTSASTPTSTTTSTSSTTGSHPLTKAEYEARLGPLLNNRVAPALRSALSNGGAKNPQKLATAAHLLKEAGDAMGSLNPPTKIAALNQQAVSALGSLSNDMSKMRDELLAHNNSAYLSAARTTVSDALKIENIGKQFSAQGY